MTASRAEELGKDESMATTMTIRPAEMVDPMSREVRRRIDPETGRALVILSHAIEYLADEFAHADASNRGQADAIQLLMSLNRQIYLACPGVPSFRQWLISLLHPKSKQTIGEPNLASALSHSRVQAER